jgi:hypothetical protein
LKTAGVLLLLFSLNIATLQRPEIGTKKDILNSNPISLRLFSFSARHLIADYFWLLSHRVDEVGKKRAVNLDEFMSVYSALAILDTSLEIGVIYSSTYVASIEERGDLGIELLQLGQKFEPESFQFLFTELIFQIVYIRNRNIEYLKNLAQKVSKLPNSEKFIGKIDVKSWTDDIIRYLQREEVERNIRKKNREWVEEKLKI